MELHMRREPERQNWKGDQDHQPNEVGDDERQNAAEMVENVTSCTTLLITNTFMPTGGWINPSSTVMTMMTPNQIDSLSASRLAGDAPRREIAGTCLTKIEAIHPALQEALCFHVFLSNWDGPPRAHHVSISVRLNRRALRENRTEGGAISRFTKSENC
jgi:hypothetical protein